MFQRIGAPALKKDLSNTLALCALLDDPQNKFKSIHVAGTNGKGSVAHMLAAVYQEAGLKVGIYSSPHLRDFRERIKINGEYITENEVVEFVHSMQAHLRDIEPSFFETTVAMAFAHFAKHAVDLAIVETGLGGRLDSTNVITPLLSIITNVSLEHQQYLGNTLEQIAGEKAGIIKPGLPVVVGERHRETDRVFERKAHECGSQIVFAEDTQDIELIKVDTDMMTIRTPGRGDVTIGCGALYQVQNAQTALCAVDVLSNVSFEEIRHVQLDAKALARFKQTTNFRGRWDVLSRDPLVIADGAHNAAALERVFAQLNSWQPKGLRVILGVVKDKDLNTLLQVLPHGAIYYCCSPDIPRGLNSEELERSLSGIGLNARAFGSVGAALNTVLDESSIEDVVFIGGSIFIVGEALAHFNLTRGSVTA